MSLPLRWHERLLIRLLLRSPRIDRIVLLKQHRIDQAPLQHSAEGAAPVTGQRTLIEQFERMHQGPAADR